MAGSARYTVVLDACVLYPAPVRDLLLSLAYQGLFHARWTDTIAGHADAIVTFNLKDFPTDTLQSCGLEARHPDDFVVNQLHLNQIEALKAIKAQRARLIRPAISALEFLATITRCGLPQTASLLADSIELI